jgi:hypothetical protein
MGFRLIRTIRIDGETERVVGLQIVTAEDDLPAGGGCGREAGTW